jgi:sarcosine oxidase
LKTCDVAVLGLGAMGSAALYQLAKRGVRAIGIDRLNPPHTMGSSHGETRITREAVGEGQAYVPLVRNSHRIWRELEAESGETLLVQAGVLILASSQSPSLHHGKPDFVRRSLATAQENDIPHEFLRAEDIRRRFPQFIGLTGDEIAYFEPGGGYVHPERCIAVQLARARQLGVETLTNTQVLDVVSEGGGVRIETEAGPVLADQAVVTVGSWVAPLLGREFAQLALVHRQVLHWFEVDRPELFASSPVFIWMHGPRESDYLYGFPPLPGQSSLKVATEQYETASKADDLDRTVPAEESLQMFDLHVRDRLAGVSSRISRTAVCMYTTTPDRNFIIDRHPENPRLMVVSACSGHGFKHSSGIGEVIAQSILGQTALSLDTTFSLNRLRDLNLIHQDMS